MGYNPWGCKESDISECKHSTRHWWLYDTGYKELNLGILFWIMEILSAWSKFFFCKDYNSFLFFLVFKNSQQHVHNCEMAVMKAVTQLKIELSYDNPETPLLGIYPKDLK